MTVLVTRQQAPRTAGVTVVEIRRRARRMMAHLGLSSELSVVLTNDETIYELNRTYRGKDRPTDVLAFAMREGEAFPTEESGAEILGDVVISLETAARQAAAHRRDTLAEVTMLLAHGLLHLVGYDHRDDAEERAMTTRTRSLVRVAMVNSTAK